MIYFDNAATGGFKPQRVIDTCTTAIKYLTANPGRSGHRLSVTGAETISNTRQAIAETFGGTADRVIFTKNCTESLNTAIFGLCKAGDHVITTVFEHNSVLRPLFALRNAGVISLSIVAPKFNVVAPKLSEVALEQSKVAPERVEKQFIASALLDAIKGAITDETSVIVMTAVSNVTGTVMPVSEVGAICKEKNITFIVDGAQGGGHVPLDVKQQNISALCLAGHKGLYGIMGSGVLVFSENTEISPLTYGGTGSDSFNENQPPFYPDKLESGTLNLPSIVALNEGIRYLKNNFLEFSNILTERTELIINELLENPFITCYSSINPAGIVSFSVKNLDSNQVADILNDKYDVAVRGGFHCAPLCHKYLGTDNTGLVRVSLSPQNSKTEINYFLRAIKQIASNL